MMTTTIKMFIFYELNVMKMLELTVLFSTKRNISQLTLIASARVVTKVQSCLILNGGKLCISSFAILAVHYDTFCSLL